MPAAFMFGRADDGQGTLAGATTAQATATLITHGVNLVTTDTSQTAFRLPASHAAGSPILVVNSSSGAALVFPPSGGKVNNGSADASFSVAQNKPTLFFAHTNGIDYTAVLSA